jgi:hypothetical protein
MDKIPSFDQNGCIESPVRLFHHYANEVFGAFVVKEISRNNLFISILDSKGQTKKASYRNFLDSIEISQESFEALFRIGCPDTYLRYKKTPNKNLSQEALEAMIEKSDGIGIYGIIQQVKTSYAY